MATARRSKLRRRLLILGGRLAPTSPRRPGGRFDRAGVLRHDPAVLPDAPQPLRTDLENVLEGREFLDIEISPG